MVAAVESAAFDTFKTATGAEIVVDLKGDRLTSEVLRQ
jgi:hypothetical protein